MSEITANHRHPVHIELCYVTDAHGNLTREYIVLIDAEDDVVLLMSRNYHGDNARLVAQRLAAATGWPIIQRSKEEHHSGQIR